MDLAALETVLKKWWKPLLSLGTGDTNSACYAADGKQPFVSPTLKAAAFYSFTSIRSAGVDETSYEISGTTGKLIPTVHGNRYLALTIRVDSYDQRPNLTASYLAERARTRLRMPKTLENLSASGYGLVSTGPILLLPFPLDDRLFSRAAFELRLAVLTIESEADATNELDRIDTIEVDSEFIEDIDGSQFSEQISFSKTRP